VANLTSTVEQAQAGDLDAFGALVRECQDMAVRYARSLLGDAHLAEDAAQEAFVVAYRNLLDLRSPGAFPAWLRRIVFTRCDRITRRRQISAVPLDLAADVVTGNPGPDEAVEKREILDRVLKAIRALEERKAETAKLFYVDGYSQREVADFMAVPMATVKARLHAARQQLKARMMYLNEED